jgi:competence ComEA-like helix-hairpin-helix protein
LEIALEEEEEVEFEFEEEPLEAEFEEMPSSEEEIPAWLSEFAEEEEVEEIEAEEPAAEFEAEAEVEAEPEAEGPRELLDVNTASLSQLESLPGVGFITAQNIVNYRENFGPFNETAELKNVTGVDQEALALLENHIKVEKAAEAPQPAEIDLEEPGQVLEQGRALLREGEVDQALEHYNRLIGQKQDLDTVIEDLQDALFNHPMNIALYQSLGDAHMRSDQLQAALDVYTKAEELLR